MELDELKKTWNLLDEKLKQETLADSRQIEALIASCKDRAGRGVDSLARNQRLSMWLGGVVGVALLVVGGLFSFLCLTVVLCFIHCNRSVVGPENLPMAASIEGGRNVSVRSKPTHRDPLPLDTL